MYKILFKDIYLISLNRQLRYIFALFWAILLFMSSPYQFRGLIASANVLVAFLVTVTMTSGTEGQEATRNQEMLFCSLPVKRAQLVYASYALILVVTAIGVAYTYLAGLLLAIFLPDHLFSTAQILRPGEALMVFSIMLFNAIVQNPLNFKFGSQGHRKLVFMGLIFATVIASFFLLPLAMVLLSEGGLSGAKLEQYGPFAPMQRMMELFSHGRIVFGSGIIFVVLSVLSIRLSVTFFDKRDL